MRVKINHGGYRTMNYKELLNRTITRSGLKNVELIEKLKEKNISITPNYLSVLRNSDNKIPSVDISRAIAEICNAPSELLVIQGDLDRLENGLKKYIDFSIEQIFKSVNIGVSLIGTEEQKKALSEWCSADFICDFLENPNDYEKATDELLETIKNGIISKKKYAIVPLAIGEEIRIVNDLKEL